MANNLSCPIKINDQKMSFFFFLFYNKFIIGKKGQFLNKKSFLHVFCSFEKNVSQKRRIKPTVVDSIKLELCVFEGETDELLPSEYQPLSPSIYG